MNAVVWTLLFNLLLTLAAETAAALLCGVRRFDLLVLAAVNCLTNPALNYVYFWLLALCPPNSPLPYVFLAAGEGAVVLAEAWLFKHTMSFSRFQPWKLSLLLNAASFAAGAVAVWVIKAKIV